MYVKMLAELSLALLTDSLISKGWRYDCMYRCCVVRTMRSTR